MYINNDINYLEFLKDKEVYIFGVGIEGKRVFTAMNNVGIHVSAFVVSKLGDDRSWEKTEIINLELMKKRMNPHSIIVVASSRYSSEIKSLLFENGIYQFVDAEYIDYGGDGDLHYGRSYFEQQIKLHHMFADYKALFFREYIRPDMCVVEFGCSGGALIGRIEARQKIGVEINDIAREYCEEHGLRCVKTLDELPDNYADIVFSADVLEHVTTPFEILETVRQKLRGGWEGHFFSTR